MYFALLTGNVFCGKKMLVLAPAFFFGLRSKPKDKKTKKQNGKAKNKKGKKKQKADKKTLTKRTKPAII